MEELVIHFKDYSFVGCEDEYDKKGYHVRYRFFTRDKANNIKKNFDNGINIHNGIDQYIIEKFGGEQIPKLIKDGTRGSKAKNFDEFENYTLPSIYKYICDEIEKAVNNNPQGIIRIDGDAHNSVDDDDTSDRSEGIRLFNNYQGRLYTKGYCGAVHISIPTKDKKEMIPVTVRFTSRFDDDNSYFLMYVFEKAFNIKAKIFGNMEIGASREHLWDYLLIAVFFSQLNRTLKKGVYRQYQEFQYNDCNVKGRIDIANHIKNNLMPEGLTNGKISYVTREFTLDNDVNRLILRALSCLMKRHKDETRKILNSNRQLQTTIAMLQNEVSNWDSASDVDIIKRANKKIVHNVYKDYEMLRSTSIAIIKRMGVNVFSQAKDKASGILLDMPKLWEEFLFHTIFHEVFHEESLDYKQKGYPFIFDTKRDESCKNGMRIAKPDYIYEFPGMKNKKVVLDAKYKKEWEEIYKECQDNIGIEKKQKKWKQARADVFQVVSYMHLLDCIKGGFIFPYQVEVEQRDEGWNLQNANIYSYALGDGEKIKHKDESVWLVPVSIPCNKELSADEFRNLMEQVLRGLIDEMRLLLNETIDISSR